LPFRSDSFDFVTSFSAIDHIPSRSAAYKSVSEFARVTKPKGHVVVTAPNKLFLLGPFMMTLKSLTKKYQREDWYYWNSFSLKELAQVCVASNMQIVKYGSKYPLVVGPGVMRINIAGVFSKVPQGIMLSSIKIAIRVFKIFEDWGPVQLGARAGFDAAKPSARYGSRF